MFQVEFGIVSFVVLVVGLVAWFIRLESKVLYLEKDHENKKDHDTIRDEKVWAKFDAVQVTVNQILVEIGKLQGRDQ